MRKIIEIVVILAVICSAWSVHAQEERVDSDAEAKRILEIAKRIGSERAEKVVESQAASFDEVCNQIGDSEVQKVCWESYKEYLRYYQWGYAKRKDVIHFQNVSTKIILIVVVSLVFFGMFLAWHQFRIAMQAMKQKVESDTPSAGDVGQQEIKISNSEIVVKSSYLGVIILVVSLAFFYLYLVFVYPINEIL